MGFEKNEVADILAWKMLPTLVHELTHGMEEDGLSNRIEAFFDEIGLP